MYHLAPFACMMAPARLAMVLFLALSCDVQAEDTEKTLPTEPTIAPSIVFRLGSGAYGYPTPLESE